MRIMSEQSLGQGEPEAGLPSHMSSGRTGGSHLEDYPATLKDALCPSKGPFFVLCPDHRVRVKTSPQGAGSGPPGTQASL